MAFFSVVFFAGLAWQLWKWHQAGKRECQRRLMTLVEQITDIIQTYQPEGIPEQHVIFRDFFAFFLVFLKLFLHF
jgi:hypothetical protein